MSSTLKAHRNGILILAVLLVGVLLGFVLNEVAVPPGPSGPSNVVVSSQTTSQMMQYVRIIVEATQGDSEWSRNSSTDLPEYVALVTYIIRNEGTATANETRINIRTDSAGYKDYSVSVVAGGYFGDSVRLRFQYDTTHEVVVEASCDQSSDRVSLTINANLPRTLLKPYGAPSAEMLALSKLFITPNDPDVRRTLYEAMSTYVYYRLGASYHPSTSYPDWVIVNAIEDWVYNGRNVRYASDSDVHGVANYAQLPKETLQLKIGDSEDIAILFVSLLRAAGVDDDSVFVALGTNGATCYGWIRMAIEQSNDGQYAFTWYRIAPRPTDLTYYYGDIPQIDWPEQYAAVYYFNDANVVQLQH